MSANLSLTSYMPEEVNLHILSYLNPHELARCCQVDKRLSELANLWKPLFPDVDIPSNSKLKTYIDARVVKSKEEVIQRIQAFATNLVLNQKCLDTIRVY